MVVGNIRGSDKGNHDNFAIRDACMYIGLMVEIGHRHTIKTHIGIIQVVSMNTPLLCGFAHSHRGKMSTSNQDN
jgi:hypothetical protein